MCWRTASCAALLLVLHLGCTGVPLRPDGTPGPEECPAGALEAMRELGIRPGDKGSVEADATQYEQLPARLMDGIVIGFLDRRFKWMPERTTDAGGPGGEGELRRAPQARGLGAGDGRGGGQHRRPPRGGWVSIARAVNRW